MKRLLIVCVTFFSIILPHYADLPKIIVSVPPQVEFVKSIAGDTVEVYSLIPEGENLRQPTYSFDPENFIDADLYITIGMDFEEALIPMLKDLYPNLPFVSAIQGIPSLDGLASGQTSFPWLSLEVAREITSLTLMGLVSIADPEHIITYMENFEVYAKKLMDLQDDITIRLGDRRGINLASTTSGEFFWIFTEFGFFRYPILNNSNLAMDLVESYKKQGGSLIITTPWDAWLSDSLLLAARSEGLTVIQFDPFLQEYYQNMETLGNLLNQYIKMVP